MIHLDSAAVVKLAHVEPESGALRRWLDERAETGCISSVLTEIEAFRALARYAPGALAPHTASYPAGQRRAVAGLKPGPLGIVLGAERTMETRSANPVTGGVGDGRSAPRACQ
jgi:hypothetical protein